MAAIGLSSRQAQAQAAPRAEASSATHLRRNIDGPSISARDHSTVEIRSFFADVGKTKKPTQYQVDTYWFFPRSFGVNKSTWGGHGFYRDSRVYMRLHSPTRRPMELADPNNPRSPLYLLARQLPLLVSGDPISGAGMVSLARMLGAELAESFERLVEPLLEKLEAGELSEDDALPIVRQLCRDALEVLDALRRLRHTAVAYRGVAHPELVPSIAFSQDYVSASIADLLASMGLALRGLRPTPDASGARAKALLELSRTLARVYADRRAHNYPMPNDADGEYYNYRIGLVKKELQQSLYISTRDAGRDPYVANSAAMVAAGLAAVWATLAQIPLVTGGINDPRRFWFIAAAVGAYILKDRIKDWVKMSLSKRWTNWDRVSGLASQTEAAWQDSLTGTESERVSWLTEDKLPKDVLAARHFNRSVKGTSAAFEEVLHHRQLIELARKQDSRMPSDYGVQQILRLSLDHLLARLDETETSVRVFDTEACRFERKALARVYHLNVIVRVRSLEPAESALHRARVVLNRNGIVRIEKVATDA